MFDLLRIYHRLPYPLKVVAASSRGLYLKRWRYSSETDKLVAEAIEREVWDAKQWQTWQEQRLAAILHRAATKVPFYRDIWSRRRQHGDRSSWEVLENWMILDKEELRKNPVAFVDEDCDIRQLYSEHTSGTSGKPITLWFSRRTIQQWYALYEARFRIWNGVSRQDHWAILGGQLVTPYESLTPPFWVWNYGLKQLYMSSYHLKLDNIFYYVKAMEQHHVKYLLGYSSALYSLAQGILEKGLPPPQLKLVISNAEPLYEFQRQVISCAFQCPVHTTYGMTEIAAAASECDVGSLHYWPDAGIIETFEFDRDIPVCTGDEGRIICTGLLNEEMPLIRYEVGDRGILTETGTTCACGRTLPVLKSIEGRLDDVIVTADGRRVGRLDPIFKADFGIREAQIIQENLATLIVKVVPSDKYTESDGKEIERRLHERVGDMKVVLEIVEHIPRSANGKFRSVVSLVGENATYNSAS